MFVTLFALAIAAQTTPSTPPAAPSAAAPGEIQAKSTAFATCIRGNIAKVPASVTPEAGADQVMLACKSDRGALEAAIDVQLAAVPAESQAAARQQIAASFAQAKTSIANGIRTSRAPAAAPTPAAPAPAPAPAK